jgi:hypothetical protein
LKVVSMRKSAFAIVSSVVLPAVFLVSAGCGSSPEKPAEPAPKAEPVKAKSDFETGRAAFQRMYVSARTWAPDAQPVRLESRPNQEDPKDGRAGMWAAVFVSASKQNVRTYVWSGIATDPDKGVSPGSMDYYSPANASTRPFDLNFLKVDSDRALEVAGKKGGAALLKKDPKQPIKYMLFFDAPKARLLWRVIYGTSQSDSKLKVLVSASSGEFVAIEK